MQLLAPDILAEARELSAGSLGVAFAIGLALWLFGWFAHRFWIVLAATVAAGIFGLSFGARLGTQPWVAALLLAIAAGLLALALVRVIAFVAGGLAAWLLLRQLAPGVTEPLVMFLIGGLFGLLLFRYMAMAITSAVGALLLSYSGLCLAHVLGKIDVTALAEAQASILNSICGGLALLGFLLQVLLDRRRNRWRRRPAPVIEPEEEDEVEPPPRGWFGFFPSRRAG